MQNQACFKEKTKFFSELRKRRVFLALKQQGFKKWQFWQKMKRSRIKIY
jgi:hypothetical protein